MTLRRIVTSESVRQTARLAGLELSDQRADELVPELQAMLDGLEVVRELIGGAPIEPALVFQVPYEEDANVGQ